jgi:ADP-heptose:LPS heptosyltransferase
MRSILITLPSGIGDAIQSLVGLRIIEEFYPESKIVVLVEPNIQVLLSRHFSMNITFLSNRLLSFFENKQEFDALVDFNGLPRLQAKLASHQYSKIITHTCFIDPAIKEGADCIYVDNCPIINTPFFEAKVHEPKMAWTLYAKIASLLLPNDVQPLSFNMESLLDAKVSQYQKIKSNRNSTLALFPGGSSKDKHWPVSKYLALIKLLKRGNANIRVFIGRQELPYLKHFRHQGIKVVFNKPIDKLFNFNKDLNFAITNDTGLMHISGALGIGLLSIFLETTPQCWFTFTDSHQGFIKKNFDSKRRYQSSPSVFDVYRYAHFLQDKSRNWVTQHKQFKKLGRQINVRE